MPERYPTNSEIAERLRLLAERYDEPDKSRFFKLAIMYDREAVLVSGSRRAISESKTLLAEIKKFGP
jgi:hypothetical protein